VKTVEYSSKTVNRFEVLAEMDEFIKYESPFRTYHEKEVSPGYGHFWNPTGGDKKKGEWEISQLPFVQGEILKIERLDLNSENNDPRKVPVFITYYYHVIKDGVKWRFSTVYGHPHKE
jgi:hypothetical protein